MTLLLYVIKIEILNKFILSFKLFILFRSLDVFTAERLNQLGYYIGVVRSGGDGRLEGSNERRNACIL